MVVCVDNTFQCCRAEKVRRAAAVTSDTGITEVSTSSVEHDIIFKKNLRSESPSVRNANDGFQQYLPGIGTDAVVRYKARRKRERQERGPAQNYASTPQGHSHKFNLTQFLLHKHVIADLHAIVLKEIYEPTVSSARPANVSYKRDHRRPAGLEGNYLCNLNFKKREFVLQEGQKIVLRENLFALTRFGQCPGGGFQRGSFGCVVLLRMGFEGFCGRRHRILCKHAIHVRCN